MAREHNAWQWTPPKRTEAAGDIFFSAKDVQSATECTGLMAHPPQDESEAHALSALYDIHMLKPQGNIGKDNPRNNPAERAFHRKEES